MQEFISSKITFFGKQCLDGTVFGTKCTLVLHVPSPHMPPGARVDWAQVLVNKVGFLGVITQKW